MVLVIKEDTNWLQETVDYIVTIILIQKEKCDDISCMVNNVLGMLSTKQLLEHIPRRIMVTEE